MRRGFLHPAVLAAMVLLLSLCPAGATQVVTHPFRGVTCISRTETSPRTVNMHIVEVELTAPGIGFMVTPAGGTRDTVRQTTLDFLNQEDAQIAMNGHFFLPFPSAETAANVVGLAASQGNVYSPFEPQPIGSGYTDQSYAILPYAPALNIDAGNHASIVHRDPAYSDNKHVLEAVTPWNAVAGSAQIITNGVKTIPTYSGPPNGLNPISGYSDSNSWYSLARARTSIGLTQDDQTLVLFTVDAAGGSGGMTPGEVADLLIADYRVYNALNLDGGGSTTLAMEDPVTGVGSIVNVSADNPLGRAVGSNLAVFAQVPEPATVGLLGAGAVLLLARRRGNKRAFAGTNESAPAKKRSNVMKGTRRACNVLILGAIVSMGVMGFGAANRASAAIVSIPYNQDFSGGAGDFQTAYTGGSSTATWNASGGVYTETINRISGASFYTWSSVNVSNLGPATANSGFKISTLLENMSIGNTSVNVTAGLRFLADTTNSNTNAYVVDMNIGANAGKVRLVRWSSSSAKVYPDSAQANQLPIAGFSISAPYLLEVYGSYNASSLLDIAVRVTNMNHPTDLTGYGLPLTHITHTGVNGEYGSTPPTGHYFGFYESSSSGANTTINVTYDNFSVVPEPATLGLLAMGGLAVLRRRRR